MENDNLELRDFSKFDSQEKAVLAKLAKKIIQRGPNPDGHAWCLDPDDPTVRAFHEVTMVTHFTVQWATTDVRDGVLVRLETGSTFGAAKNKVAFGVVVPFDNVVESKE